MKTFRCQPPMLQAFVKDRLHFNEEGYKVLTAIVRKHLK